MSALRPLGAVVVGLALLSACTGGAPAPSEGPDAEAPEPVAGPSVSAERPNIVFLTLDTTRADRLGLYGYEKADTETLDALAAAGRVYERAWSPLPLTIPSHATMFTGLYPPRHGIRSNGGGMVVDSLHTLPEMLQAEGWATGASVSAYVTTRVWGFSQGFDAYFDEIPEGKENFWHGQRAAEQVIDDGLGWASTLRGDGSEAPIFLWIHLYDAHFPFTPPPGYLDPDDPRPYDAEIAYVDDQVKRLVDHFAGEPTLFVVAGDHGEGLGDKGELTHGLFAYEGTQRIPLFLSGPGIEPARVREPASLADITPTLLDHLDLPVPDGLDGLVRPAGEDVPVYMESYQLAQRFGIAPHVAVADGRWKLIDTPRPELYDLDADPRETQNVAADHPEVVARLQAQLQTWSFPPPSEEASAGQDPEVAAALEALGYVDGSMEIDWSEPLPDPKDHPSLIARIDAIERLGHEHQREKIGELMEGLIADYPDVVEFRTRLATVLRKQGEFAKADAVIEEAYELQPTNPMLKSAWGAVLAGRNRYDEATRLFVEVAEEMPFMPRARALAVQTAARAGDIEQARTLGEAWFEDHADDDHLAGALALVLLRSGEAARGLELLEQGVEADVPEPEVCYLLAVHEMKEGDPERARALLAREVENYPGNPRSLFAYSRLLMSEQDWPALAEMATAALEVRKDDPVMWHAKVLALFNQADYAAAREAVDAGLEAAPTHPDLVLMDANLLAKEGDRPAGVARFEEAKKYKAEREERIAAMMKEQAPLMPGRQAQPEGDNVLGIPWAEDAGVWQVDPDAPSE